jgi:hypothetical protein
MWFEHPPCWPDFWDTAPYRFEVSATLDTSPERLYQLLLDAGKWPEWFTDILEASWSAPPRLGTERRIRTRFYRAAQRALIMEPGRRFAFCFVRSGVPVLRHFMEDMWLDATADGRTCLRWRVAFSMVPLSAPLGGALQALGPGLFRAALANLRRYVHERDRLEATCRPDRVT